MTDQPNTSEPAPDTAPPPQSDRMVDPAAFRSHVEPAKIYSSVSGAEGRDGARDAARDLVKQRQAEVPIRRRRLPEDAPPSMSAKNAAEMLSVNRQLDRASERWQRTGEHPWVAGHITAREMAAEAEPKVIRVVDETLPPTARKTAEALASYRTDVAPQEEAELAERRRLAAEWGVQDLVQPEQQASEPPAETPPQPELPPQPNPVEVARQQAEAERAAYQFVKQATADEILVRAQAEQLFAQAQAEFGDVRPEDIEKLSPERRQRYGLALERFHQLQTTQKQLSDQRELAERRIGEVKQAQELQAFKEYKTSQDKLAEKAIPELRDPEMARTFQKATEEMLAERGVTPDMVRSYSPEMRRAFFSSTFQEIVADAVRYRLRQQKAEEVQAKPLPPVQRPGVSQAKGSRTQADVGELLDRASRQRGGSEKQLRAFATALATRRRGNR